MSIKYNLVAPTRKDRWHKAPTSLFGGISIFVSFMLIWGITSICFSDWDTSVKPILPIILGGTAIFLIGLADDIFDLNPQYKLIGQVLVSSFLVIFGIQVHLFASMTVNLLFSIFWIVGITNAFNLLDNMDGLSAGTAFISGAFLFLWVSFFIAANPTAIAVQWLLAAYLGSLLGFLVYNFYPASIFMGDAGSLFIGFLLACLTLIESPANIPEGSLLSHLSVILMPCLILFVPIIDTTFVSFMRKAVSRSIFQGGIDHSSHRMVAIGLSERKAVLILYLFAAISGLLALAMFSLSVCVSICVIAIYLVIVLLFWTYLGHVEVYPKSQGAQLNGSKFWRSAFMEASYVRTLLSVVLDLILITIAYYTAYLLRFEGDMGPNFNFFLKSLPIMYACQVFCFFFFGIYQRLWWGSRMGDMGAYVRGVTAGTVASILVLLFIYRFHSFSRAVFVIYWGILLIFILFSRFFFRIVDEWARKGNSNGKPTLIYGAGVGGQMVVKEIETNGGLGLSLVGFIDDNPMKKGKRIYGYPVFGGIDRVEEIIKNYQVKEVIVSFKDHGTEKKKELSRLFNNKGFDISVSQMKLVLSP